MALALRKAQKDNDCVYLERVWSGVGCGPGRWTLPACAGGHSSQGARAIAARPTHAAAQARRGGPRPPATTHGDRPPPSARPLFPSPARQVPPFADLPPVQGALLVKAAPPSEIMEGPAEALFGGLVPDSRRACARAPADGLRRADGRVLGWAGRVMWAHSCDPAGGWCTPAWHAYAPDPRLPPSPPPQTSNAAPRRSPSTPTPSTPSCARRWTRWAVPWELARHSQSVSFVVILPFPRSSSGSLSFSLVLLGVSSFSLWFV
jgi:hypothetical protein